MLRVFDEYLREWALRADGPPIVTPRCALLPVLERDGSPAMLKIVTGQSQALSSTLLKWWDGRGAARVHASRGPVVLMERSEDPQRLLRMYERGLDEATVGVIVDVAARLHAKPNTPPPDGVPPLASWFADLLPAAERLGGILVACARAATALLETQTDVTILHGDLHHENVLHFGDRGWLAIDPKGVMGERTFEFVPSLLDPDDTSPLDLARLERQIGLTATAAQLDPVRLRLWLLAWSGLSAVWWLADGKSPEPSLRVAAAFALSGSVQGGEH